MMAMKSGCAVALVQKQRETAVDANLQLALKDLALHIAWGNVPEVIQAGFAHRDHSRLSGQLAHEGFGVRAEIGCMVGMHPGCGEQLARVRPRKFQRCGTAILAGAGDNDLHHAGLMRARQHCGAIRVECVMGQVAADIDQFHVFTPGASLQLRALSWKARSTPVPGLIGLATSRFRRQNSKRRRVTEAIMKINWNAYGA
jgi:hypothetical protein